MNRRTGHHSPLPAILLLAAVLAATTHPLAAAAEPPATGEAPGSPPSTSPRSLSRDQARALALANDEQVAQMQQAIQGARADVMAAGSGRLPRVDAGAVWTRNLKKPVFFLPPDLAAGLAGPAAVEMGGDWDLQAAATVTLNLWTAGRLSAARAMASEALAETGWRKALVMDAVIYAVDAAYWGVQLAEAEVTIAEASLQLADETLRTTTAAEEQGEASRFDLLRARVERSNRESPLIQARNVLEQRRLQLSRLCGLPPGAPLVLTDSLQPVAYPAPLEELVRAAGSGPELVALDHRIRAAEMAVSLARAGRGPVVSLQGQYAVQGQWDGDILPGSDEAVSSASAALAVSVPLFDGYAARADIQGREADLRIARLERERIARDRELGVRQGRIGLENALAALEGRREAVMLAEEAVRLAQVRRDNGLATPLEILDADLALTRARAQLVSSLHACEIAAAGLELAVGGAHAAFAATEGNNP